MLKKRTINLLSIYNLGISFYYFVVQIISCFNIKAKQLIEGQKATSKLVLETDFSIKTIWFHCASVGEFEQGYPLLNKLRIQFPTHRFLITFYSPSGYNFVSKKYPQEWILYLPKDTQNEMKLFISKINPSLVFVVKYEFWFHLLNELKMKEIPTFLVSGIFRKNQLFFKPIIGSFFASILNNFSHLFVQDKNSFDLLNSINIQQKSISGDTRFDRVLENKNSHFEDKKIEKFIANKKVFIAGSCWSEDVEILKTINDNLSADWKIILVPHELNHFKTDWIKESFQFYTSLENFEDRILIIDIMGLLSKLYRYSNLTYIGGGFGKGIHNILEPAVFGRPILIGPNYHKFNEATILVEKSCVFSVPNKLEAQNVLNKLLQNPSVFNQIEQKMNDYIDENTNVSDKIIVYLNDSGYLNL